MWPRLCYDFSACVPFCPLVIAVPVFLLVFVHEKVVLGAGHPRSHSGCIVTGLGPGEAERGKEPSGLVRGKVRETGS
jgi:hypothetical protein